MTVRPTDAAGIRFGAVLFVWVAVVAATLISFWLGTDHGIASATARNVVLLTVAFLKVRYIGLYFMELKAAPWSLRGIFEVYCLGVCVMLVGMYLWL